MTDPNDETVTCPAGSPDCGYVGGGDSDEDRRADWEHMFWEHKPCTECPARPRDGDSLTHFSGCPRLQPGYRYPPVSAS